MFKLSSFRRDQRGFSLPEVMLAGALLAGVGVAFMKLIGNQTKSFKSMEASSEIESSVVQVQKILSSPNGCNATFASRSLRVIPNDDDGVVLNSVRISETNDFLTVGQTINKDVDLVDMRVKLDLNNFDPETGYGLGEVLLTFGKGANIYGGKNITKSVNFYAKFTVFRYYTNPTGNESTAKTQIASKCKSDMGYSDVVVRILKQLPEVSLGECLPRNPTELFIQDCD